MPRHTSGLLALVLAMLPAWPVFAETPVPPIPKADWSEVSWPMAAAGGLAMVLSAAVGGIWAARHRRAARGVSLFVLAIPAFAAVLATCYLLLATAGVALMEDFPPLVAGIVALAAAASVAIWFGRFGARLCQATGAFAGHHLVNFVLAVGLLVVGAAAVLKDVNWTNL